MPTPTDIRKARLAVGLTQAAAAALIDVQRVTWARWESGITPPPSAPTWRLWLHLAGIERIPFKRHD
jgi:DNA-binding XRE family transcriptional regulator